MPAVRRIGRTRCSATVIPVRCCRRSSTPAAPRGSSRWYATTVPTVPRLAEPVSEGHRADRLDTEQIAAVMNDDTDQSFAVGDRTTPGSGCRSPRARRAPSISANERRG